MPAEEIATNPIKTKTNTNPKKILSTGFFVVFFFFIFFLLAILFLF
jgi:hypothetical protein